MSYMFSQQMFAHPTSILTPYMTNDDTHTSSPYILTPYIPNELRGASECAIQNLHLPYIYSRTLRTAIISYVFSHPTQLNNIIHVSSPYILTPYIPNELRSASACAIKHIHLSYTYSHTLRTSIIPYVFSHSTYLIHVSSTDILTPYIPNELRSASECAIKNMHVPYIYILAPYVPQ